MNPTESWNHQMAEDRVRAIAAQRAAFETRALLKVLDLTGARSIYTGMRSLLFEAGAETNQPGFEHLLLAQPSFPVRFHAAKLYHLDDVTLAVLARSAKKTQIHRAYMDFDAETADDHRTKAIVFQWPGVCSFAVVHANFRPGPHSLSFSFHYAVAGDPRAYVIEPLEPFIKGTGWTLR